MTQNSINNTGSQMTAGTVKIDTNVISTTTLDQNLTLTPNGAGLVSLSGSYTIPAVDGSVNQVLSTNGAGVVSFVDNTSSGFTWSVVTAAVDSPAVNTGVFYNNAVSVVATMPTTAAVGDRFQFVAQGANGFTIGFSAGQSCQVGDVVTTTETGTIVSTGIGDWIELVCDTANDSFFCNIKQGNVTTS